MKLGDFIKEKRKERNLSVWTLAALTGVSGSYISLIETGKITNFPSEELINKISKVFELNKKENEEFYDYYDELILPERIKEKIRKNYKKRTALKKDDNFYKLEKEGIYISDFSDKQMKKLIEMIKLVILEEWLYVINRIKSLWLCFK